MNKLVTKKEYNDLTTMYNDCQTILHNIQGKYNNTNLVGLIKIIRNSYNKDVLNSYYIIGNLPQYVVNSIKSKSIHVRISIDSLLKNILEHPEISILEYQNIKNYMINSDYIFLKNKKNIIYFKISNVIYQFVIKNTKNNLENYITTFHKASIKQLEKDLRRYSQIKR